ncbi:hypothetical protein [Nocardioides sp. zg-DK7169]|uniref:hypothetical protein n=1 Tax=Nocardioides sp. zg-DK7169 TaxID=2736600 RepID=UPI0015565CE6|nr:hypothetical protein [Nocardioides sp. zg-DK7169]NPC98937.1 hypothetical protein [Nocardioides sp. zg-DK7169]
MMFSRWFRRAAPHPSPQQPGVRAEVGTVGLLTASLSCGQCHTRLRVDVTTETVRHEVDRTTRPLRVTDGPRSWLLEWRCPACEVPSHATLPMVSSRRDR